MSKINNSLLKVDSLYGHKAILEQLTKINDERHPPHSFIFSGPPGIGKKKTALLFAKHLLCEKKVPLGCNECSSCKIIEKPWAEHPDLSLLTPFKQPIIISRNLMLEQLKNSEEEFLDKCEIIRENGWLTNHILPYSGGGVDLFFPNEKYLFDKQNIFPQFTLFDKKIEAVSIQQPKLFELIRKIYTSVSSGSFGSSLGVSGIRSLVNKAYEKPFFGQKRVFIIDNAEKLTVAAENALLKTLEEPPSSVTIILITSFPNTLLSTVRSRCCHITFSPLSREVLKRLIVELKNCSEEEAKIRASLCFGNILKALTFDSEKHLKQRQRVVQLLSTVKKYSYSQLAEDIAFLSVNEDSELDDTMTVTVKQIIEGILLDLLHVKLNNMDLIANSDIINQINELSKRISIDDIVFIAENFISSNEQLEHNVVTTHAMERFLLDVTEHFH